MNEILLGVLLTLAVELWIYGIVAIVRDVRDRRRIERMQAAILSTLAAEPKPPAPVQQHPQPISAYHWPALPYRRMN